MAPEAEIRVPRGNLVLAGTRRDASSWLPEWSTPWTPSQAKVEDMALIAAGAEAPDFELDSHLDTTVKLSDFRGQKNVLLVSYPLDFTPT